jgi:hypothetical protein
MNKRKLNRLFELARTEPAPVSPDDFAADVLHAVHREPPGAAAEMLTFNEQLNRQFPRIAFAAATIIVVCIALDFGLTAAGIPGLSDSVSQISAQWFLTPDELSL